MKKNKIIILIITCLIIAGLTFLAGWIAQYIKVLALKLIINIGINLFMGIVALVAAKVTKMDLKINWKNYEQYLIGLLIALALSLVIAWIPALCGTSLVGNHAEFILWEFLFNFLYYMLIIGPVEEFIFRVYIQDTTVGLFEKNKWIGVIIASFLFGIWHLINGGLIQVLFTFIIGCVFGFAKQYIKKLEYPGVALSHGLYDFLNYVVRLTIV